MYYMQWKSAFSIAISWVLPIEMTHSTRSYQANGVDRAVMISFSAKGGGWGALETKTTFADCTFVDTYGPQHSIILLNGAFAVLYFNDENGCFFGLVIWPWSAIFNQRNCVGRCNRVKK